MAKDPSTLPVASRPIDDFWPRVIGIPTLGVVVPLAFDLWGPIPPGSPRFWLGLAIFVGLSLLLWQGNRALLFATAARFDWLERPWWRVGRLVLGIVLYTAPLSALTMAAWFAWGRQTAIDEGVVRGVVLTNVICVVFVAHVYETVLLLRARSDDAVKIADAERARAESELLALRRQIDPHFLFNCLNTLGALVREDSSRALAFNDALAAMLRYLLETSDRHLVPLSRELEFVSQYAALVALRFGEAFQLEVTGRSGSARVPPTSVQLLVENAVTHNRLSRREPLVVEVAISDAEVRVSHLLRPRSDAHGTGLGLKNLAERMRLVDRGAPVVETTGGRFSVTLSLGAPS